MDNVVVVGFIVVVVVDGWVVEVVVVEVVEVVEEVEVVEGLLVVVLVVVGDVVFSSSSFLFDEKLTDVGEVNDDLVDPSVVESCVVVVVFVVGGAFVVVEIFAIIFLYLSGSNSSMYARFSGVVVGRVVVVVGVGVVVDILVVGAEDIEAVFSKLGV